jgi:hypothetical protein
LCIRRSQDGTIATVIQQTSGRKRQYGLLKFIIITKILPRMAGPSCRRRRIPGILREIVRGKTRKNEDVDCYLANPSGRSFLAKKELAATFGCSRPKQEEDHSKALREVSWSAYKYQRNSVK